MYEFKAEVLDRKLKLIDENKNLLPYPYKTAFPSGLEDVGDGSILVSATNIPVLSSDVLLYAPSLPAGKKYIISLSVTNLVNEINLQDHAVELLVNVPGEESPRILNKASTYTVLDLISKTEHVAVAVYIGAGTPIVSADSLIKPQIEEVQVQEDGTLQETPSNWVPYMKTIGSYVDERFDSTNTKVRLLNHKISSNRAEVNDDISSIQTKLDSFMDLIEITNA